MVEWWHVGVVVLIAIVVVGLWAAWRRYRDEYDDDPRMDL